MTERRESLQAAAHGESYEQLQNSVENNEARAAWLDHDRRRMQLAQGYRTLKDDPRYTQEHKTSQMWEYHDREAPRIKEAAEKARELLEKEAAYHEERSIPRPKGESLHVGSTERLLAAQNQAARVVRMAERVEKRSEGNPIGRPSLSTLLRDEYARGIKAGGVEGAVVCKGVLMATEELGLDADGFLDDLREEKHMESLDKARRYTTMAQSISKSVPEPPVPRHGSGRESSTGRGGVFQRQHSSAAAPSGKRRRAPWK